MMKFFRDNQKKMLAIFGVLLMISFVATLGPRGSMGTPEQVYVGHIGSDKVSRDDLREAENEWNMLSRRIVYRVQAGAAGETDWEPLSIIAIQNMVPDAQTAMSIQQQFSSTPEALYMLEYEARKVGLTPQYDEADKLLDDPRIAIQMADGSRVPYKDVSDRDLQLGVRQSLADLLLVQASFLQAIDSVKISTPMIRHDMGRQYQEIKVRVVDFPAAAYASQVPAPTSEQLQKQFDHFADIEPDAAPSAANPFGFGYKFPDRVKVQYIEIPRAEARKAVRARKDDYSWDVDANRYYLQHAGEFPATQPATTQPTTNLALGSTFAPQHGPTTKPFAEVRQEILDKLIEPQVDKLQQQIQSELIARLNLDYQAWQTTHPTSAPSTAPAGDASNFESFEYLQKLAEGVLKNHNVTLTVASIADSFKTAAQLRDVKGLGQVPNLVDYVMTATEPFVPESQKKSPQVLQLLKPAPPMTDDAHDVYIVRVVAADPAHRPASIDEVKDRVTSDWKQTQEFDLAKADAQKLLAAARAAGEGLVPPATGDHTVITTGAYPASDSVPIENYKLSTRAQNDFVHQTYDMLSMIGADKHPMSIVEMPADGKVALAELIYVDSSLRPETIDQFASMYSDQMTRQYQMLLANNWFSASAIAQRIGYVNDTAKGNSGGGSENE